MPESKKQKQKQTNKKSSQTKKIGLIKLTQEPTAECLQNVPMFQTETL